MSQFESVWKERLYAKRIKFIAIGASFLLIGLATYLGCAHFSFERQKRDDLAAQKFAEESRQLERSTQEQNQKDEAAEIAEMQRKKILIEAEQKAKFLIDKDRNERARVKQRDNAREALSIGILAAIEAKKKEDWKQVQTLLERVEALPDNSDHPSKIIATALLQEANQELEKRSRFDAELVAVEDALRQNNYDDALKFCAHARTIVPQTTDLSRIEAYERRVQDGLAEIAQKNAVSERVRVVPALRRGA